MHYLSVCGAGIVARVCVADVAGHGEVVAKVGSMMHAELRRSVDTIDERRVFKDMDARLGALGTKAMTTAALITYYPPGRRLTFSYAGHPPGWLWRQRDRAWTRLEANESQTAAPLQDLPLGTGFDSAYTRRRVLVDVGDRIVLVTDGVLEAPGLADQEFFGTEGVEAVLRASADEPCDQISAALTAAVRAHAGDEGFSHDDITTFIGEFVPGPAGPVMWHVLKNRYLGRLFSH